MINAGGEKARAVKEKPPKKVNYPKVYLSGRRRNTFATVAGFPRGALLNIRIKITVFDRP